MNMSAYEEKYNFPFHTLEKGDALSQETIEEILGFKYKDSPDTYGLELMHIRTKAEKVLAKRGLVVTATTEQKGLQICTDSEAVAVNISRNKSGEKKIKVANYRASHIDKSKIDDDEARELERLKLRQGAVISAMPKRQSFA